MGYESRIIVARKCTCKMKNEAGEVYDDFFTVKLADMWLSRMPQDFANIFTNPVTWKIYGDGFEINSESEYDMTEDCYGADAHKEYRSRQGHRRNKTYANHRL